jgi:hypothetical protein
MRFYPKKNSFFKIEIKVKDLWLKNFFRETKAKIQCSNMFRLFHLSVSNHHQLMVFLDNLVEKYFLLLVTRIVQLKAPNSILILYMMNEEQDLIYKI